MNFEVGPWQYFGTEILTQFDDLIQSIDPQRQSIDSVANSTNNMLGQVKAVPSAISELDKVDNAGNRPSLPGVLSGLGYKIENVAVIFILKFFQQAVNNNLLILRHKMLQKE